MEDAGIKYIPEPNKSACGQACIAMVANITIDAAINICGTQESLTKEQFIKAIKQLNIYDGNFKTYRRKESLPPLCILYVQFPTYEHMSVYFNGKIYDPELGIIDEYVSSFNLKAYIPINNEELLKYVVISIPRELQVLLQKNEEANRKFNELPISKRIAYVRSIDMRKDSKDLRVKYIFNQLLNNKDKATKEKKTENIDKKVLNWEKSDGISFMKNVGVKKNDIVMDFGCGKGYYSIASASIIGEKGKVYAIDKKSTALRNMNKRYAEIGLNNIEMMKTNGEIAFNINNGTIDVVLLYDVLHIFSFIQRNELLKSLRKLLKENALLSIYPCHINEYKGIKNSQKFNIEELVKEIEDTGFKFTNKIDGDLIHSDTFIESAVYNFKKLVL